MDAAKRRGEARLEVVEGIPVVIVDGEVDIANIDVLNESLRAAAELDAGAVVVSLEEARYFDSAAIHALVSCRARLSTSRQGFLIVRPATAAGRRILEICGLLKDDNVLATRDEAIGRAKELVAARSHTT